MGKRANRLMTGDRVRQVLSGGGMARLSAEGSWRIYRGRDGRGRAIGQAVAHVIAGLLEAGQVRRLVCEGRSDRLIWAVEKTLVERGGLAPPPALAGPWGGSGKRAGPQSLLKKALGQSGERGTRIRLAAAAGRYVSDVEMAATPQSVTMRWDAAAVQGGGAGGSGFGPGGRALAASARLDAVTAAVGAGHVRVLDEVLVRGVSAAGLARLLVCRPDEAVTAAREALSALAQAYDLAVRGVCKLG